MAVADDPDVHVVDVPERARFEARVDGERQRGGRWLRPAVPPARRRVPARAPGRRARGGALADGCPADPPGRADRRRGATTPTEVTALPGGLTRAASNRP